MRRLLLYSLSVGLASRLTGDCRFPASHDPSVFAVQKTMVEAW